MCTRARTHPHTSGAEVSVSIFWNHFDGCSRSPPYGRQGSTAAASLAVFICWGTMWCVGKLLLHSNDITTRKCCHTCRCNCKRLLFCKSIQVKMKFLCISLSLSFCVSLHLCLWKSPPHISSFRLLLSNRPAQRSAPAQSLFVVSEVGSPGKPNWSLRGADRRRKSKKGEGMFAGCLSRTLFYRQCVLPKSAHCSEDELVRWTRREHVFQWDRWTVLCICKCWLAAKIDFFPPINLLDFSQKKRFV